MENILETKTIRCRYGAETQVVNDYSSFGWRLVNKILLNRFGNPLPIDAQISESDKREKCSFELVFNRHIDPEKANRLSLLENEYDSLTTANTSFGRGRITASIFMSLGLAVFVLCIMMYLTDPDFSLSTSFFLLFIMFALFLGGGLVAIVVPGALRVARAVRQNEATAKRKAILLQEARKILNS